jgi:hypothetical protein
MARAQAGREADDGEHDQGRALVRREYVSEFGFASEVVRAIKL